MKAVKANKQYTIAEPEKASYLAQGYDIIDDNGATIERSPQSTVSYGQFEALLVENSALAAENKKLKAENKKLKADKKGEA